MPKMPKEDNANFCHIKIGSMESSWPGGNALKAMLSPAVIGNGQNPTVDGCEILHHLGWLKPYWRMGKTTINWCRISRPSTVGCHIRNCSSLSVLYPAIDFVVEVLLWLKDDVASWILSCVTILWLESSCLFFDSYYNFCICIILYYIHIPYTHSKFPFLINVPFWLNTPVVATVFKQLFCGQDISWNSHDISIRRFLKVGTHSENLQKCHMSHEKYNYLIPCYQYWQVNGYRYYGWS